MSTVRAELAAALRRARQHDRAHLEAPAAVLWPDPTGEWRPAISALQEAVPVLMLGDRDVGAGQGPAIWLRAVLAATAEELTTRQLLQLPEHLATPDDRNPWVIYLPGVTRDELLDAADAPARLQPLVELAFRSAWWRSQGGAPYTPASFLRAKEGLGLDVGRDEATRSMVGSALTQLLDQDVSELGRLGRLDAERLAALLVRDEVRSLLRWIDDPDSARETLDDAEWQAFCTQCRSLYGVDPQRDTPITAAGHLGRREGAWAAVWERFAETASSYPGIAGALDRARPSAQLFAVDDPHPDSWPSANAEAEAELRTELARLGPTDRPAPAPAEARAALGSLASAQGSRVDGVWAGLGQAPLANAVRQLGRLAELTARLPRATTLDELVGWYADLGWQVDDAAVRAVAATSAEEDRRAVLAALRSTYDSWLDEIATSFQRLAVVEGYRADSGLPVTPGTCVLFVDGLRYDVGHRLTSLIGSRDRMVLSSHRLAAYPTVTPTGQPAVAPLSTPPGPGPGLACGDGAGRELSGPALHAALAASGVQRLAGSETGDPSGVAWTQHGDLDAIGHSQGVKLVDRIDAELASVADRIDELLDAGWARVLVVTDHGWLLPAAPLRKVDLPLHLTDESARKPRVARLRPGQAHEAYPVLPATFDPAAPIASAPGVAAFVAGITYDHGGLSLQECVIPVLTVADGEASPLEAAIEQVRWKGLRCRVDVRPSVEGLVVEVRLAAGDAHSTVAGPREVVDGEASALVTEDTLEGQAAYVVLLGAPGTVIDQRTTTIGVDT